MVVSSYGLRLQGSFALTALLLACSSTSHKSDSVEGTAASDSGGLGAGGADTGRGGTSGSGAVQGGSEGVLGGSSATGGNGATAGRPGTNDSPPCSPEDNTLTISTGDLLTDLPSKMTFDVYNPPSSKEFTGNGENGDVRVYLPEPADEDRVFPTATVVDPLDSRSAHVELVVDAGLLNGRYVVETGAQLYAQVTPSRVALTLCAVKFYPSSDPPGLPDITVSGRVVATAR